MFMSHAGKRSVFSSTASQQQNKVGIKKSATGFRVLDLFNLFFQEVFMATWGQVGAFVYFNK